MCVYISHTFLTLNNRFQTKMGGWGSQLQGGLPSLLTRTESLGYVSSAQPELCLAAWTSGEVADIRGGPWSFRSLRTCG